VYADEAVRLLAEHDRPAARLEEGFAQRRRAGLPTAGTGSG